MVHHRGYLRDRFQPREVGFAPERRRGGLGPLGKTVPAVPGRQGPHSRRAGDDENRRGGRWHALYVVRPKLEIRSTKFETNSKRQIPMFKTPGRTWKCAV